MAFIHLLEGQRRASTAILSGGQFEGPIKDNGKIVGKSKSQAHVQKHHKSTRGSEKDESRTG